MDDVAWNQRSLRVLDDREVLQYARLTAISLDEVFGGTVIHEWPGARRNVARGAARRMPRGDGHASPPLNHV